ncbi:MAG TPA: hypothetical protein VGN05_01930 [Parvibaculum sp.]|jgi:hypothetical protein
MQTYTQRVRESILPLSIDETLPKAFEEWSFTGGCEDHGFPIETCQLCGQEGLRYHFEIRNEFTQAALQVGSHCILQFDVAVYEDGTRLSVSEAKKRLEKLTQQMRLESCIRALEQLAERKKNQILAGALVYYRKNKKLTPKQAFVVFWQFEKNKIDHHPSFFGVSLKSQKHKKDLSEMPTDRVHFFWKALTAAQKNTAMTMGHMPPPVPVKL